ncbi:MAG: ribosomal protein S18-alanine N-acetyltransferase [Pyrinomonadaceae bacterium]
MITEKVGKFRRLTAKDISEVLEIANACGLSAWKPEDYLDYTSSNEKFGFVVQSEGEVCGFVIVQVYLNEMRGWESVEIQNIGVKPRLRNVGFGKGLLKQIFVVATKMETKEIWLEVRKSNLQARKFYEMNGFCESGVRKSYYSNPMDDAILYLFSLF